MNAEPDFARDLDAHLARCDAVEAATIARLWNHGLDSQDIAEMLRIREARVYVVLAKIRDERHAIRTGGSA